MKKFCILFNPRVEAARACAQELESAIDTAQGSAWVGSAWEEETARQQMAGTDLVFSVGGDGTILRAARIVVPLPIPIVGVNLGRLGFMTEIEADEALASRKGDTIITSDGTTLLGADDKAGVAEIVTAVDWLITHPEIEHGVVEIIFTPDEETGRGMDSFPKEKLESVCCYTLDGDVEGAIETECFNAEKATITFQGVPIHPGTARGKLVNAVTMAAAFAAMLPRNESPEATDGRYGFYLPHEISGNADRTVLTVFLRDFEAGEIDRRKKALQTFAEAVESQFPGGRASVDTFTQYINMRAFFDKNPQVVDLLIEAVRRTGLEPVRKTIRGGTDGARLSEMGIPTPNIFTGGHSYHSRSEWAALGAMASACQVIIHLITLWKEKGVAT